MKLCKNCHTIHEEDVLECTHCKMKGQLIPHNPAKVSSKNNVKNLYRTCRNCGTVDPGNGHKCIRCNFPLPSGGNEQMPNATETKIRKQQQN